MGIRQHRLIVILPDSLGWDGGDQYLRLLSMALQQIAQEAKINIRNSQTFPKEKAWHNWTKKKRLPDIPVTHLPWPLWKETALPAPTTEVVWIPDFQDYEIPEFFQASEIRARQKHRNDASDRGALFYVSSQEAQNLALSAFPHLDVAAVVRFALPPEGQRSTREGLKEALNCRECEQSGFIYWPAQWWLHKNHIQGLLGFQEADVNGLHLVMTGSPDDYRWPKHAAAVRAAIGQTRHVHYLGHVASKYRDALLQECTVIFQPSLYEGWSTTIEEGIFHGKSVAASNLRVNLEQGAGYGGMHYFDPQSPSAIAEALVSACSPTSISSLPETRVYRWERFLDDVSKLVTQIVQTHDR